MNLSYIYIYIIYKLLMLINNNLIISINDITSNLFYVYIIRYIFFITISFVSDFYIKFEPMKIGLTIMVHNIIIIYSQKS